MSLPIVNLNLPIRCQLLALAEEATELQLYIERTPQLQLVAPGKGAELFIAPLQPPLLGQVLLARSPQSGRLDALDYLAKPLVYERFLQAIGKATKLLRPSPASTPAPYFFVKSEYRLVRIDTERILYIQGMKNYAKIYLQGETRPVLSLISLKSLLGQLSPQAFLRVHRSYIVHLRHLCSVEKGHALLGQARIPVSDQHRQHLAGLLRQSLAS